VFSLVNTAVIKALSAFAAERRAAQYATQQQTRRTPLLRSNDGTTDGQTDGRPTVT